METPQPLWATSLTILAVKVGLVILNGLSCMSHFSYCPVQWAPLCLLDHPHQIFMHIDNNPLSLCCSKLNNPSSLNLLMQMLQSLNHLSSLDLLQCVHVSFVLESPALDPALQQCLPSAEPRERILSLAPLAEFCLMQPGMLLATFATRAHRWLVFNLPTRTLIFGCLTVSAPSQKYLE